MGRLGQPSIFPDKSGDRVQGVLSKAGSTEFEAARAKLTKMAQWPRLASDGDVIEFLARGERNVRAYLKTRK